MAQTGFRKIEPKQKTDEELKESIAIGMSALMGTNLVRKADFDRVNSEKQALLNQVKDINKLAAKLITTECKLQNFIQYHSKWKPTTRLFDKRLLKLQKEGLYLDFTDYQDDIRDNLKEAYKCYINGLPMACYIMILRTIEIAVSAIYDQVNPEQYDDKGKKKFIPVAQKLNWMESNRMIGGADFRVAKGFIEARNSSVHEIYVPTERQLMSAFETVIIIVTKLKPNL